MTKGKGGPSAATVRKRAARRSRPDRWPGTVTVRQYPEFDTDYTRAHREQLRAKSAERVAATKLADRIAGGAAAAMVSRMGGAR